jgi:hypothetical protein
MFNSILREKNFEITRSHVAVGLTSYSVTNISSVRIAHKENANNLAAGVALSGFLLGGVTWYYANWMAALVPVVVSFVAAHILNWALGGRNEVTVFIVTNSGEVEVLKTRDVGFANRVKRGVETALAAR